MMKIEKEHKFKREYVPVLIGSIILILFSVLLVLTINYDGNVKKEEVENKDVISDTDDLAIDKTNSKCSKEQLNSLVERANKVKAEYYNVKRRVKDEFAIPEELDEGDDGMVTHNITEISISGIVDNIYAVITNNYDDYVLTIKSTDLQEDGTYKFDSRTDLEKVRYVVSIYASNNECQDELLRKVTFTTKLYNIFTDSMACSIYPNYSNCAKFVDEEIEYEDFRIGYIEYQKNNGKQYEQDARNKAVEAIAAFSGATEKEIEELRKKNENANETILKKVDENKELITIAIVIIAIGILSVILLMFIRRNKI